MLKQDTPLPENVEIRPGDPHKTASGSSRAPGGSDAAPKSQRDLTHGQESYPGDRDGSPPPGRTPQAGDVDPGTTQSGIETGQADDTDKPENNKANPWN